MGKHVPNALPHHCRSSCVPGPKSPEHPQTGSPWHTQQPGQQQQGEQALCRRKDWVPWSSGKSGSWWQKAPGSLGHCIVWWEKGGSLAFSQPGPFARAPRGSASQPTPHHQPGCMALPATACHSPDLQGIQSFPQHSPPFPTTSASLLAYWVPPVPGCHLRGPIHPAATGQAPQVTLQPLKTILCPSSFLSAQRPRDIV